MAEPLPATATAGRRGARRARARPERGGQGPAAFLGEDERRHDGPGEQAVDVAQLVGQAAARRAVRQVGLDGAAVPSREAAADVGAEPGAVRGAGRRAAGTDVGLEVALAQPLPRPVGQHRDRVGGHADGAGDVPGAAALDGGVPQHRLPAVGEIGERLGDERPVGEARVGLVGRGHDRLGDVVERVVVGGAAVAGQPADRDEEVGAERVGGPAPTAHRPEHPLEGLVHEVLGVDGPAVPAGHAQGGRTVAHVQLAEGVAVAVAGLGQQLGVRTCGDRHRRRALPMPPRPVCRMGTLGASPAGRLTARSTVVTTTF